MRIMRGMTLADYLNQEGLTNAAFASEIKVNQSTVARLRNGDIMPSKAVMVRIFFATKGKVRADDFYGLTPT